MIGVSVRFEGLLALAAFSFQVQTGEVVGLIGPNGAGKTTAVNVLSGFQRPTVGEIRVDGLRLTGATPRQFVRHGIARTFQSARLFGELTVRENVEVGCLAHGHPPTVARRRAGDLLALANLERRADAPATTVPHGEERLVAVARALACEPRFLLLDEPAAGSSDDESRRLADVIRAIRDETGIGVVLIEHDMQVVMRVCDRMVVLDHGRTIASASPEEIRRNEEVREAYFGPARGNQI